MSDKTRKQFLIAGLVGVGALLIIARYRKSIFKRLKSIIGIYEIPEREIVITESPEKCVDLIKRMKVHCEKYNVLGFDAEWVSVNGSRRPVAIIQLCTSEGLCGLIRLNKIGRIPQELRDILEDNTILKVGVAPLNDANLLFNDYSIRVSSTFDLRFLALKTGMKPGSLGNLTKEVINIDLDKDWKIRCSDWEANKLSDAQVDYAAKV
jgi:ribonuclease D